MTPEAVCSGGVKIPAILERQRRNGKHEPVSNVEGRIVLQPGDRELQRGVVLDAAVEARHGAPLHHLVLGASHNPGGVCKKSQRGCQGLSCGVSAQELGQSLTVVSLGKDKRARRLTKPSLLQMLGNKLI